jgi:hypothetical protein
MRNIISETNFQEKLRLSIYSQWNQFEYYRNVCKREGKTIDDLLHAIDNREYFYLPSVAATAFKKSKGLLDVLNDLSQDGIFQVSSSTSGDPSYVYTNSEEVARIRRNYDETFEVEGVSRGIAFSPVMRIVKALSKQSDFSGKSAIARMQFGVESAIRVFDDPLFTVDVDFLRTIMAKIRGGNAVLIKKSVTELIEFLMNAEKSHEKIIMGGFVLLFYPYLMQMNDGQFSFGNRAFFTFSGGGYCGSKGSIKTEKIDKLYMVEKIADVFSLTPNELSTNIKDVYGFTESPGTHEGYWNNELKDFLFETWHETRIYIVDPETEKPLKSGEGLIKIISPYLDSVPSAANVSLLQYDLATIRGINNDLSVSHFSHIRRFQNTSSEGCAFKADEMSKT